MVPVQVSEEDGPGKRLAIQQRGDPADTRSGVENDCRRRIVMGDGNAGGVPAVADEARARRGSRPADTAEMQPHGLGVVTLFFAMHLSDGNLQRISCPGADSW